MDIRTRVLETASALLQVSNDHDISTRAVSEAVGVGAPVLYRLFGDKNGLLSAVVDHAFEGYLREKRAQPPSPDPSDGLYAAWDAHVQFALANPIVYRVAYAPALDNVPAGVEKARQLLLERCDRCAQAGQLRTTPAQAAQAMMAACVGICLCLLSLPATFTDPDLSKRVRDAVLSGLLIKRSAPKNPTRTLKTVSLQLAALIRAAPTPLTNAEIRVLLQWLDTISATTGSGNFARCSPAGGGNKVGRASPRRPREGS